MKLRLVSLLLALTATGCAVITHGPPKQWRPTEPESHGIQRRGVMRLVGRLTVAHACPCDGLVLTAGHVAAPFVRERDFIAGAAWSDQLGNQGYVRTGKITVFRDIATLELVGGTPHYYARAQSELQVGDEVFWLEYEGILESKERRGRIVGVISGHYKFEPAAPRGASGTCLFNGRWEVAGVVSWRGVDKGHSEGIAPSVAGPWWPEELEAK